MKRLFNIPSLPVRLDIGCGKFKREGFVGMDIMDFNQEILWDINHGIPLPNDSVNEIYSSHFFEHLSNEQLPGVLLEIYRVGISGAELTIIVPHADTDEAHYLCHYSFWNESKIRGIVKDSFGRIELIGTKRDGIHFIMKLKIGNK